MPQIPQALAFMAAIEPVFTQPAFATCLRLVAGWVLCPARRTLTGIYPFADPQRQRDVQVYHYFFRAASWAQGHLFRQWARYQVGRLCANQKTILLALDDTVHRKTGPRVNGARTCRDAVRSTSTKSIFCWALQYLPLCLVYPPPWGGEPLALPLTVRLNRKKPGGATLLDHAVAMLREVAEWLPDHDFRLVADGAFAALAGRLPPRVTLVSRLRADAALFELPPPRKPGTRGRPRLKGDRLPVPKKWAAAIPDDGWNLVTTWERGSPRERLVYAQRVIWVRVSKRPVLLVLSRDPEGREADDFFFSTDEADDPAAVVGQYADRWSVEDTFRNVKQYLGAEQPQSWKGIGPERVGAFSYFLYGVVWLARIGREGQPTAALPREWYDHKSCVSFLDALADLRQCLWNERINATSATKAEQVKIQELLIQALSWAA